MMIEKELVGVDPMMQSITTAVFSNILGSHDVQEMLCINRSRMNALVSAGKLKPIKELKRESLFWFPQVEQLRNEMLKDSRTNLFKQSAKK